MKLWESWANRLDLKYAYDRAFIQGERYRNIEIICHLVEKEKSDEEISDTLKMSVVDIQVIRSYLTSRKKKELGKPQLENEANYCSEYWKEYAKRDESWILYEESYLDGYYKETTCLIKKLIELGLEDIEIVRLTDIPVKKVKRLREGVDEYLEADSPYAANFAALNRNL